MFSGPVAANGYYYAANDGRPESIIIIGPNHTGYGSGISISIDQIWRTPFGDIDVDSDLAKDIQRYSHFIDIEASAHRFEHSIGTLYWATKLYNSIYRARVRARLSRIEKCICYY